MSASCLLHKLAVFIVFPTLAPSESAAAFAQSVALDTQAYHLRDLGDQQYLISYRLEESEVKTRQQEIRTIIEKQAEYQEDCAQVLFGAGVHPDSQRVAWRDACRALLQAARRTPLTEPVGGVFPGEDGSNERLIFLKQAINNWNTQQKPRLIFYAQNKTKLEQNDCGVWLETYCKEKSGGELLSRIEQADGRVLEPKDFIDTLRSDRSLREQHDEKLILAALNVLEDKLLPKVSINLGTEWLTVAAVDVLKIRIPDHHRENLEIEILEGGDFPKEEVVIKVLALMEESKFRLAIDDFGTSNANFDRLASFANIGRPDERRPLLKVDMQFVKPLTHGAKDFLPSFVALAKTCDFNLCFEGVEDAEDKKRQPLERIAKALNEQKFGGEVYIQGYAFHKPSPLTGIA